MKTNISTTREQSDRLLQCGVPAESADMCWRVESGEINIDQLLLDTEWIGSGYDSPKRHIEYLPTWSLSALLGLLPKEIKSDGTTYKLNIDYPPIGQVAVRYNTEEDDLDSLFGVMDDDLFELIVLMVEKLVANGYALNGIEKGGEE